VKDICLLQRVVIIDIGSSAIRAGILGERRKYLVIQ